MWAKCHSPVEWLPFPKVGAAAKNETAEELWLSGGLVI
jgi:hypothetical protein